MVKTYLVDSRGVVMRSLLLEHDLVGKPVPTHRVGARGHAFPDHAHPIMRCGSQVASNGNRIKITSRMRSVTTNGITPLKIVANDTSLTTLLITKTFIPTGGWMRPSSTVITMMTPNQIGPKPSSLITGKMIGTVRITMASASIRHPSTTYMTMISASTP